MQPDFGDTQSLNRSGQSPITVLSEASLHAVKLGRKIVEQNVSELYLATNEALVSQGLAEHVAVLTYGACANRHLVSRSDTDYSFVHDGTPSEQQLIGLQEAICDRLKDLPYTISFKSWERVKPNPMEVVCLRLVCGNSDIFENQIVNEPELWSFNKDDFLITNLAGIKQELGFLSSLTFARQLRTWRSSSEIPEGLGYGELKHFNGGLRAMNAIMRAGALFSDSKFLGSVDESILVEKNIVGPEDLTDYFKALDFFLAARDLCVTGSNIFNPRNMEMLKASWGQSEDDIQAEYDHHIAVTSGLINKIQQSVRETFPDHPGVRSAVSLDKEELRALMDSNDLQVWGNLAARKDLPNQVREELESRIEERQKVNPHTMLNDLEYLLEFARVEEPFDPKRLPAPPAEDQQAQCWLTDQVFNYLDGFLEEAHSPKLVQAAIEGSYLRLYSADKFADPETFHTQYLLRARNFFHTRTIFPEKPMAVVRETCANLFRTNFEN